MTDDERTYGSTYGPKLYFHRMGFGYKRGLTFQFEETECSDGSKSDDKWLNIKLPDNCIISLGPEETEQLRRFFG